MRPLLSRRSPACLFVLISYAWLVKPLDATNLLESTSLDPCMEHSAFSASYFNVRFTPNNNSVSVSIKGNSGISGKVLLDTEVLAYGYPVFRKVIDPCIGKTLLGFCPMNPALFELPFNAEVPKEHLKMIPTSIYEIPDLDATIRIYINSTDHFPLACVQANLSNGRTVHQVAVAWILAVIAFLAFVVSVVASTLGQFNSAAHLLSDSLSLFGYYQSLAFIGMTSVRTSPIVRAWTQNFQWSVGVMRLEFFQKMATWYQRATGGTPTTLVAQLSSTSIRVERRDLVGRTNAASSSFNMLKSTTVSGIEKVGFQARIETSNLFFTVYIFFILTVASTIALTALATLLKSKYFGQNVPNVEKISTRRQNRKAALVGNLFHVLILTFSPMIAICLWEFTRRDSACELVLAALSFLVIIALALWAAIRTMRLGQRSISLHSNPAYILYSDFEALVNYGVFYIPFRAYWYFFKFALLSFAFVEASFIGLGQNSATSQAVAILIMESAKLTVVSLIKPYMDSRTNSLNVAISTVGLMNAIMLTLFTRDFGLPALGIGIMGAIFFFINAVFLFVLIALLIFNIAWTLLSHNPNRRYKTVRDDRNSFMTLKTRLADSELRDIGIATNGLIPAQRQRPGTFDLHSEQRSETSSRVSPLDPTLQEAVDKGVPRGGAERTYTSLRSLHPMTRSAGSTLRRTRTL